MNAIYVICKSGPEWCEPVAYASFKREAEAEAKRLDGLLQPGHWKDGFSRHEVIRVERHVGRKPEQGEGEK